MTGICRFCQQTKDLRLGGCWDCADAESIIHEGTDMYDMGMDNKENNPALSAGQKLRLLIDKGWVKLSPIEKEKLSK